MWEGTGKNRGLRCLKGQKFLDIMAYKIPSSCLAHYSNASWCHITASWSKTPFSTFNVLHSPTGPALGFPPSLGLTCPVLSSWCSLLPQLECRPHYSLPWKVWPIFLDPNQVQPFLRDLTCCSGPVLTFLLGSGSLQISAQHSLTLDFCPILHDSLGHKHIDFVSSTRW